MIRASRLAAALALLMTTPVQAIVGPARDGDDFADRVVMVLARRGARQSVCSGVALAPRVVLTAAHCLADAGDMLVAIRAGGATRPVAVTAAARHPGYDADATRMRRVSIDLALVETSAPLEGFRFSEIADAAPALGDPVTVAGFGVTREGGPPSDGHIRLADLAAVAPASKVTLWTSDPGSQGRGACHGDSGAPMFSADERVLAVVAWTNGVKGHGCGAITQGALVAPARAWIDEVRTRWGL